MQSARSPSRRACARCVRTASRRSRTESRPLPRWQGSRKPTLQPIGDLMDFDFAEVLLQVMERNASDLHLTAGSPPMIRHHGKLHPLDYPHLTPQATREVIYSILTNEQRQRLEKDWQIDLAYSIPGRARFRENASCQRASLSAAFRLIPQEMPALRDLGLPNTLEQLTKKPRGFVLVTGPTGSGKSTTLAAMIDLINESRSEHILTIEDPI